jgi:hypothetical protein
MLVRRGNTSKPRPSTLRAIADGLGGNYERMMILAGHIEPPKKTELAPELRELFDKIVVAYMDFRDDPQAVQVFEDAVSMLAEGLRIVAKADAKSKYQEERSEVAEESRVQIRQQRHENEYA